MKFLKVTFEEVWQNFWDRTLSKSLLCNFSDIGGMHKTIVIIRTNFIVNEKTTVFWNVVYCKFTYKLLQCSEHYYWTTRTSKNDARDGVITYNEKRHFHQTSTSSHYMSKRTALSTILRANIHCRTVSRGPICTNWVKRGPDIPSILREEESFYIHGDYKSRAVSRCTETGRSRSGTLKEILTFSWVFIYKEL